jgi:hypothetical protein
MKRGFTVWKQEKALNDFVKFIADPQHSISMTLFNWNFVYHM